MYNNKDIGIMYHKLSLQNERQNNAPLFHILIQKIKEIASLHEKGIIWYGGWQTKVHWLVSYFCKCTFIRTQSCPFIYALTMAVFPYNDRTEELQYRP